MRLEPNEIMIGLDTESQRIRSKALAVRDQVKFEGDLRFLVVPNDNQWKFQLANLVWHAYEDAQNDIILSYDVDTMLGFAVKKGLKFIGRNDVAVVTFRKFLALLGFHSLIQMFAYWSFGLSQRSHFAGLYFVWRPAYFDLMKKEEFMSIENGVDGWLVNRLLSQTKYRLHPIWDFGCYCLTEQNEDYNWRQVQHGIWIAAHGLSFTSAFLQSALMARPLLLKAYLWALSHPSHQIVELARRTTIYEFSCLNVHALQALGEL